MLYQVATAALSAPDISSPIRSVLRKHRNIEVVLGEAVLVDISQHNIALADGSVLPYDYLALAPGARHSYFSHPEWEILAPGLKNLEDAGEVRRRILLAFERAELEPDPVVRQRHLTFVIVGGGRTGGGVEGGGAEGARLPWRGDCRRMVPGVVPFLRRERGPHRPTVIRRPSPARPKRPSVVSGWTYGPRRWSPRSSPGSSTQ